MNIPKITALPFVFRYKRWEGAFYIDGSPHHQQDKTKVYMWNGKPRIMEQGGVNMSLVDWLIEYKKISLKEAMQTIESGNASDTHFVKERQKSHRYVSEKDLLFWQPENGHNSTFFTWLCTLFPNEKVLDVFNEYRVGQMYGDVTIFFYINRQDQICHDNRIRYSNVGKRVAEWRKYKVTDGFTDRCYFGDHLLNDWKGKVGVVESEKAAIIMRLFRPDYLWLACGGASKLNLERKEQLFPDYDRGGLQGFECRLCPKSRTCEIKRNRPIESCLGNCVYWWTAGGKLEEGWGVDDWFLNNKL